MIKVISAPTEATAITHGAEFAVALDVEGADGLVVVALKADPGEGALVGATGISVVATVGPYVRCVVGAKLGECDGD
jgi:hypothetical protein